MRVGLDISGSEISPLFLFSEIYHFAKKHNPIDDYYIFLTQKDLVAIQAAYREVVLPPHIHFVPCFFSIQMHDHPIKSTSRKKSVQVEGLNYLQEEKIDVFYSPANTGAMVTASKKILGNMKGVEDIAIALILKTKHKKALFLDAGATLDMRDKVGESLAWLGIEFCSFLKKIPNPKVSLINVGEESFKGIRWVRRLDRILLKNRNIVYQGYIEPNQMFHSDSDVFLVDGFSGNLILKTMEGTIDFLRWRLKKFFPIKFLYRWFEKLFHRYNKKNILHAGILLGVNGLVLIGHGRPKPDDLYSVLFFLRQHRNKNFKDFFSKNFLKTSFF